MLENKLKDDSFFSDVEKRLKPMGLEVVEASKYVRKTGTEVRVSLFSPEKEVDTGDLAAAYNVLYPRLQITLSDRDLSLEVSSPGLQRNFKDIHEFEVFKGKTVRVYSTSNGCWIEGDIESSDDSSVTLASCVKDDCDEALGDMTLEYADIQKAKLAYRWEESKK